MNARKNSAKISALVFPLAAVAITLLALSACDGGSTASPGSNLSPTPPMSTDEAIAQVDRTLTENRKADEEWRAQQEKTKQSIADGTYERPHSVSAPLLKYDSDAMNERIKQNDAKWKRDHQRGVTMSNYMRLKTGMTYQQVVSILDKEGTELSKGGEDVGVPTVLYVWDANDGNGALQAMFQKNRLVQKSQLGLR